MTEIFKPNGEPWYVGGRFDGEWFVKDTQTVLQDPTTLTIQVEKPDKTITAVAATRKEKGVYTSSHKLTAAGTWHFTPEATGQYEEVETFTLRVLKAPTTP